MGDGSPWHSTADDDSCDGFMGGFRRESENSWSPFSSGLKGTAQFHFKEELARGLTVAVETRDGITSTRGSRHVESEARIDVIGALESGDFDVLGRHAEEHVVICETQPCAVNPTAEVFPGQNTLRSKNVASEFQISPLAPTTAPAFPHKGVSLLPARKRIFKLNQIENDNQDLSFVEKVILCRSEIFRLCNDISGGSARTSDDKIIVDFGSLNSKSMEVVGCFGSKDIMRGFFRNTKFTEQDRDVWTQIQIDTLAPGLYAWLRDNSIFIFYWHQGHSLPVASRKDMSCNFIRYLFDLCDTVYVCLDDRNVKNCVFESSSKFSKHRRTQRLQVSLVKASEDSIKMTGGFYLEGPCLGPANELPSERPERSSTFGHGYQFTEGRNRIALLASSPRPKKLASVKRTDKMNVCDFPAFINQWTVDRDYRLDVRNLTDSDFVSFIYCAKLEQANKYDRLLASNESTKEIEGNKQYDVDKLVEEAQKQLSRYLESFLDGFLRYNYPSWEEKLMGSISTASDSSCATSKEIQSLSGEALHQRKFADWNELSSETVADELNRLEDEIYGLLFGKNSEQRIIFPTSVVTLSKGGSQKGGKQMLWTIADGYSSNRIAQAFYGQTVTLKCISDSGGALKSGKVHRCTAPDDDGPLLSEE